MSVDGILIRAGSIDEAVKLSNEMPEFDKPYVEEIYVQRLGDKKHLIAIAEVDGQLAGFKVGYDKFGNSTFYTWMGGVLPQFRKKGLAKALAEFQENYARNEGYNAVILKTRNRHKNMLHFAISSGFEIIEVEPRAESSENRILLKKKLF